MNVHDPRSYNHIIIRKTHNQTAKLFSSEKCGGSDKSRLGYWPASPPQLRSCSLTRFVALGAVVFDVGQVVIEPLYKFSLAAIFGELPSYATNFVCQTSL